MRTGAIAFLSGTVFSVGLGLAGMTRPEKVVAFLDVFGAWDPSLALVMGSAVAVYAIAFRIARGRSAPLFSGRFALPTRTLIDAPLIGGAALFGIGWGLSGYCPGPAIASLPAGGTSAAVFVATMAGAMWATSAIQAWARRRKERRSDSPATGDQATAAPA